MLNKDIRVDLHIHSRASEYKEKPDSTGKNIVAESDINHLDDLFDKLKAVENRINMISITDHNRFDPAIYEAINERIARGDGGTVESVLAGVEFDVLFQKDKPKAHVITIFDVGDWLKDPDACKKNYEKIHDEIEKNKLNSETDKYDLDQFESILKNIGLNVILIAHQHQSLTSQNVKKSTLSSAADNAIEYVRFGYIDALEYTKSRIQGIILSDLVNLDVKASTIVGSDCHTWTAYPNHDRDDKRQRDSYYSTIRALPTFKGLLLALTSPSTRFQQPARAKKPTFIDHMVINGKKVELCSGINAIIGENGAGKSSLLSVLTEKSLSQHVTTFTTKRNTVQVDKVLNGSRVISIKQGQLEESYNENESGMFEPSLYPEIDNTQFEAAVKNWSNKLKEWIDSNIESTTVLDKLKNTSFRLNPDFEKGTYYIQINEPDDFTTGNANPHKVHMNRIENALAVLTSECETNYYSEGTKERSHLDAAIQALDDLLIILKQRSERVDLQSSVKNIISRQIALYKNNLKLLQSDKDTQTANYQTQKKAVSSAVLGAVKDLLKTKPTVPKFTNMPDGLGVDSSDKGGFKFYTSAEYKDSTSLSSDFLKKMNNGYKTLDAVLTIDSIDEAETAVPGGFSKGNWKSRWDSLVTKFIADQEKTSHYIMNASDTKVGSTLGEQALTFYEYSSLRSDNIDVFVVDQPEDHISNARISKELTTFFNRMRNDKQIILVTHSPLLVVNQDVDNVIVLNEDKKTNKLKVQCGCLEFEGILDQVAKKMEGGTEAVRKRWRVYGETA